MDDDCLDRLRRELAVPLPHPELSTLQDYSDQVNRFLLEHFATLPDQAIGLTAGRAEMERLLREPAPEKGTDFVRVLDEFRTKVYPYAFRVSHPRFLAFVPGAPNFLSVLGDWLISGTNFFAGVWLEAAGPAQVELVVLDWLRSFLGLPETARGVITSGGSEANLTALVAARESFTFEDRARAMLYVTEHRHHSIDRAAKIIGLRPEQVRTVRADDDYRLDVPRLTAMIERDRSAGLLPWAVVVNAGSTNTGTVDPLAELASLCRAERLWFHVDAAYGWAAALTPEGRRELRGIDLADSVALDPHKWFGQTFEAGCVLVRDGGMLNRTFALAGEYLQDVLPGEDQVNFADHGIALTRRFRALKIWLSVKVLGIGWYRSLVERCCRLADLAEALLRRTPGFEILSSRQLSILCFRYCPPAAHSDEEIDRLNARLIDGLRATGRAFLSSTRLHGRFALRMCFINWRTTSRDVEEIVSLLAEIARGAR